MFKSRSSNRGWECKHDGNIIHLFFTSFSSYDSQVHVSFTVWIICQREGWKFEGEREIECMGCSLAILVLVGDKCGWIISQKVGIIVSSKVCYKSLTFDMVKAFFQICKLDAAARENKWTCKYSDYYTTTTTGWKDKGKFHSASFYPILSQLCGLFVCQMIRMNVFFCIIIQYLMYRRRYIKVCASRIVYETVVVVGKSIGVGECDNGRLYVLIMACGYLWPLFLLCGDNDTVLEFHGYINHLRVIKKAMSRCA